MRRLIGSAIAGGSVALGLFFVLPADQVFTWRWFGTLAFICVGTTVGNAI